MPKAAGMQLLLRFRNSPGALTLGDARTSDDHSPRRTGPLHRPVRRFVNRSHHHVKACPERVERVGPMTKRLSDPYALRTASEGTEVI